MGTFPADMVPAWVPIALVVAGAACQVAFVRADLSGHKGLAAVLKSLASLAFVLVGVCGMLRVGACGGLAPGNSAVGASPTEASAATGLLAAVPNAGSLVALGLVLGAVGDVCHALRFLPKVAGRVPHLFSVGAVSFLLGHLAYLCVLVPACPVPAWGLIASAAFAALTFAVLLPRVQVGGVQKVGGGAYLLAVSLVAGFACAGLMAAPSVWRLSLALGGVLFLLSDTLLGLNTFGRDFSPRRRAVSLLTYYAAQLLIAASLLL